MNISFYLNMALENIKKNKQIYVPFLLSSSGIVGMYYIIASLADNKTLMDSFAGAYINYFLNMGSFVLVLFSIIFLFYSSSFSIKQRKSELGLYNILGLERKHIVTLIFVENVLCYVITMLAGLGIGIVFEKVMFLILLKIIGFEVTFGAIMSFKAILTSVSFFGLIFMLLFIYNAYQVLKLRPIELIKEKSVGEKEPKAKWLLSLLGIVTLVTGYYLALTVEDVIDVLIYFFPAVILVIIGTYLLFTTGSIVVLKLLKNNKRYFYQTNHFITISNMMFRMKKNAVGLASICILSTMILVMISSSLSLWFSIDGFVGNVVPYDMVIISDYTENIDVDDNVQNILNEEKIKTDDFISLTRFETTINVDGNELTFDYDGEMIPIVSVYITQEDYEKLTSKDLHLTNDEVYVITRNVDYNHKDIVINNKKYNIREVSNEKIDGFPSSDNINTSNLIIVVDSLAELKNIHDFQDEFSYSKLKKYTMFNYEGNIDEKVLTDRLYQSFDNTEDFMLRIDSQNELLMSFRSLYGAFLFLGIFLGIVFLMAIVLIMYYKQISEGSEDSKRYDIMIKVGLSDKEIRKTINSQVLLVFFVPLIIAIIHLFGSYKLISLAVSMLSRNFYNNYVYWFTICIVLFTIFYIIVYILTSRVYYRMVVNKKRIRQF